MATARLAAACPTMYLSSSATIRRGVSASIVRGDTARGAVLIALVENLHRHTVVGEHADLGGDPERLARNFLGRQSRMLEQRARRGQGIRAPGAHRGDAVIWFHHIAAAREHEHVL